MISPLIAFITIWSTSTIQGSQQLQTWARSEWSQQDRVYSSILDEVRPFYGKDGFIDEKLVAQKYEFHVNNFLRDKTNSLLFMRALAWHEIALSDGNIFRFERIKPIRTQFVSAMRMWSEPVNSFAFVRTMAICYLFSTSPDMFVENKLIEKLYAKKQSDTELELTYAVWASMNSRMAPNRLTIEKILEKQEQLSFRKGARLQAIATCYLYTSTWNPPSKRLLEKFIETKALYIKQLPNGHANDSKQFRDSFAKDSAELRKMARDWS